MRCSFIPGVLFLILSGQNKPQPVEKAWHITGPAQGSTYHITYYSADSIILKSSVDSILNVIDVSMSLYNPNSLISQFNKAKKGLAVDEHFVKVTNKALEIARETDGVFDPTVYPLMKAWGFGPDKSAKAPEDAELKSIMKNVGYTKISLKNNRIQKSLPQIKLDLNGIAQGYTVDVVADFIGQKGIKNYLVEVGGEMRTHGKKQPQNEPFKVGIEAPDEDMFNPTVIQKVIYPGDGAITTSGSYRQFHQNGKKKISHLINAKTGYPVDNELLSVTVWAKDAITADGFDNALMAMGLKKALVFMQTKKEMEAYFIYKNPQGAVVDTATGGFYPLMKNRMLSLQHQ